MFIKHVVTGIALHVLFLSQAHALKKNSFYGGVGFFNHSLLRVTSSPTGEASFFGPFYYPFFVQSFLPIGEKWFFGPSIGYTIFGRTSPDGGQKMTYLYFTAPFGQEFRKEEDRGWDWNFGPGLWLYTISGSGGTKVLNNGTSTATFGIPGSSQTIKTWSLNGGVGYSIKESRFAFDLVSESLFSARRSFSFLLSFSVRFWGIPQ
jgi:hypothetical protein